MNTISTQSNPHVAGHTETAIVAANAFALVKKTMTNLIGDELARSPEIDLDAYIVVALGDDLTCASAVKGE